MNCQSVFSVDKTFEIDSTLSDTSLHNHVRYFHDDSESLDFKDLIKLPIDKFTFFNAPILYAGYHTRNNWYIIDLENTLETKQEVYFSNQQTAVETFNVKVFKKGVLYQDFGALGIKKAPRYINGEIYFLPIILEPNDRIQIVVKIRNPYGSVRPYLKLISASKYEEQKIFLARESHVYYFVFGVFSLILLSSLVVFVLRRELLFLYYFLFAMANGFVILCRNGFLLSVNSWFVHLKFEQGAYASFLLLITALLFFYEFNKPFLKSKFFKWNQRILLGYIIITFLILSSITYKNPFFVFFTYSIVPCYTCVLLSCVLYTLVAIIYKSKSAIYVLLSMSMYFYFGTQSILFLSGYIKTPMIKYSQEISVGFELIVLTLAMIMRLSSIFKENIRLKENLNQQQIKFIQKSIEIQNNERNRISKELHDDIGQQLTGLKLLWYFIKMNFSDEDKKEKFGKTLEQSIESIRLLSHQMMPMHLEKSDLNTALGALVNSFDSRSVVILYEGFRLPDKINDDLKLNLYRITQEAINNALKYSGALEINVHARCVNQKLIISITDNGKGFYFETVAKGYGFLNMENRAVLMNGILTIESEKNRGTNITVRVPLID